MHFFVKRSRLVGLVGLYVLGCEGAESDPGEPVIVEGTSAEIGPAGGELTAPADGAFAGFSIKIPAGALGETVTISFEGVVDDTALPETAERVGPQISIEPAGTVLSKPAELTVPLDPEMLAAYEGTPDTCKVWARSGEAWERIEAVDHGAYSVTVPLSELTTAAAGVNFTAPGKTCKTCPPAAPAPDEDACESISQTWCLVKLPRPSNMTFLDDFASLRVVGRKVYWAARVDGEPTVLRYDLDEPGDAFVYPSYPGAANGTIATRGKVAVKNEGEVWASFAGYGNLRFRPNSETQAYDRPPTRQPAGVMATAQEVTRFARESAGTNTIDVRIWNDTSSSSKFLFNYAKIQPEASNLVFANPPENIVAQGTRARFFFRSIHRGTGFGSDPGAVVSGSGFWGANFEAPGSTLGTVLDNDLKTFGPAGFAGPPATGPLGGLSAQVDEAGTSIRSSFGAFSDTDVLSAPATIRDLAFRAGAGGTTTLMAIATGREEVYEFTGGDGLTTIALPEEEVGMMPWRIERIEGGEEESMLIVVRGPLTAKGQFYLLKKK